MNEFHIFSLTKQEKHNFLNAHLLPLHRKHFDACSEYRKLMLSLDTSEVDNYEDLPPLSVKLFKELELLSVSREDIFKVLKSSGTTGQVPSKIFLDRDTAQLQTKVLVKIMQSALGKERLPMLIIDSPSVLKDSKSFSARGAGILGFSNFGRDHVYALNEDLSINFEAIEKFSKLSAGKRVFIFGFTYLVWKNFIQAIDSRIKFNFSGGVLLHGGGWKKLREEAVSNQIFKDTICRVLGEIEIFNYYGLVEQVGSIFLECKNGFLHAPEYADVLIRDIYTGEALEHGKLGVIQLFSIVPMSYPGNSILTEDMGEICGEDDCQCGKKGKYFKIHGRIPKVEVRGCSDTV